VNVGTTQEGGLEERRASPDLAVRRVPKARMRTATSMLSVLIACAPPPQSWRAEHAVWKSMPQRPEGACRGEGTSPDPSEPFQRSARPIPLVRYDAIMPARAIREHVQGWVCVRFTVTPEVRSGTRSSPRPRRRATSKKPLSRQCAAIPTGRVTGSFPTSSSLRGVPRAPGENRAETDSMAVIPESQPISTERHRVSARRQRRTKLVPPKPTLSLHALPFKFILCSQLIPCSTLKSSLFLCAGNSRASGRKCAVNSARDPLLDAEFERVLFFFLLAGNSGSQRRVRGRLHHRHRVRLCPAPR
jgi:hypothetical protein